MPPNPNKLRVTVVTSSYPVRENPYAGVFVYRNVAALEKQNMLCAVIRPGPAQELPNAPRNREVIEVRIRKDKPGSFLGSGFPEAFSRTPFSSSRDLLRCVHGMTRAIRDLAQSSDAIIAHWALPAGLAALLALAQQDRAERPKLIVWLHSSDVFALERIPGGRALAKKITKTADHILAVSQDLAIRFEVLASMQKNSVGVLYPGLAPGPPPTPVPAHPYKAIFVGRLEKVKGPLLMGELAGAMPHWEFTVVGKGSQLATLQRSASRLANLRVIPGLPPEKIRAQLDAHHLLILPGRSGIIERSEGLPTVLLEALDAGRPVVAANTGGVGALISSEEGFLVAPGKIQEIIGALSDYEDTATAWRRRSRHCHEKAAQFSAEAAAIAIKGLIA